MIERYSEVSDGKRYHAMNRDHVGEWCKYEDVEYVSKMYEDANRAAKESASQAEAYENYIANCGLRYGISWPVGTSFNAMVTELLAAAKHAPKTDITERLRHSSETLLTMNAPIAAHLCQEAADEIEYLRQQREEAEQAVYRERELQDGVRDRKTWG